MKLIYFEFQISEFLKANVVRCFKDEERQLESLWIRECFNLGQKTEDLVLEAVEHRLVQFNHI